MDSLGPVPDRHRHLFIYHFMVNVVGHRANSKAADRMDLNGITAGAE